MIKNPKYTKILFISTHIYKIYICDNKSKCIHIKHFFIKSYTYIFIILVFSTEQKLSLNNVFYCVCLSFAVVLFKIKK